MWWHGPGHGPGGWWWIVPVVWTVLFWGAVAAGGVYLLRRRPAERGHGEAAEAVLADRFARGEISDEEYRERLAVLRERTS